MPNEPTQQQHTKPHEVIFYRRVRTTKRFAELSEALGHVSSASQSGDYAEIETTVAGSTSPFVLRFKDAKPIVQKSLSAR
jgi:hypothetical protein